MASDFFENQDIARRNTGRLVLLFGLAVVAIVATLYAIAVAVVGYQGVDPVTGAAHLDLRWWNPDLLVQVGLATLAVVAGGSLYKTAQLRAGGRVVAESLGGRLVHGDTVEHAERVLLNVVDEMALASGTASPPVYLLDGEPGLNAFAAGFTPDDAVIGVTRGCLDRLSRSELQGVIAHEFSHILNGDMGLNIRLMGVIHGILLIGIIGYFLLRSAMLGGRARRGGRNDNGGVPLLAIGFGLMVVGFLGTLFGNLIKASVSRQREFLADASAVQFTRDPSGIAGALKKIGGFDAGSSIDHPNAPEASHMFFSQAIVSGLNSWFATHPPLAERIRRLDPSFQPAAGAGRPAAAAAPSAAAGVSGLAGAVESGFERIGQATPDHIAYAHELIGSLPPEVRAAAREPYGARAVCYALLIGRDPAIRRDQLAHLGDHADAAVAAETARLLPAIDDLEPRARLPLVDLLVPALRQLSRDQYATFGQNVERLIRSDGKIDLFEWTLQRVLMRHLAPGFGTARPRRRRAAALAHSLDHAAVALSALAHAGGRSDDGARGAFERGAGDLGAGGLALLPRAACGLAALDEALFALDSLAPREKRSLLHACAVTVAADGAVGVREAELLRAIADSLGCPMPPLLPGQPLV